MLILRNCRLIKDLTEDYSKQYADILLGTIPPGRSELCRLRLDKLKEHMWFEITALIKPNQQSSTESCVVHGNMYCEA